MPTCPRSYSDEWYVERLPHSRSGPDETYATKQDVSYHNNLQADAGRPCNLRLSELRGPALPGQKRKRESTDSGLEWRTKQTRFTASSDAPSARTQSTYRSTRTDDQKLQFRGDFKVRRRDEYSPGLIIRRWMHQDAKNPSAFPDNEQYFDLGKDRPLICSKTRMMIVLETHAEGYSAVQLLTHTGRGVQHKSEEAKDNYVSIVDTSVLGTYADSFPQQSRHPPLRTKGPVGHKPLDEMTVVKVDELIFCAFDDEVGIIGMLEYDSMVELLKLAKSKVFRQGRNQVTISTQTSWPEIVKPKDTVSSARVAHSAAQAELQRTVQELTRALDEEAARNNRK